MKKSTKPTKTKPVKVKKLTRKEKKPKLYSPAVPPITDKVYAEMLQLIELSKKHNNIVFVGVVRTEKPKIDKKTGELGGTGMNGLITSSGALKDDLRAMINKSLVAFQLVPDPQEMMAEMMKAQEQEAPAKPVKKIKKVAKKK